MITTDNLHIISHSKLVREVVKAAKEMDDRLTALEIQMSTLESKTLREYYKRTSIEENFEKIVDKAVDRMCAVLSASSAAAGGGSGKLKPIRAVKTKQKA